MMEMSGKRMPVRSESLSRSIGAFATLLLSGAFILAATNKVLHWEDTMHALTRLLPGEDVALSIAVVLILIESMLVVLLLSKKYRSTAAMLSGVLILFFTGVIAVGHNFGVITTCPCFGKLLGGTIGATFYLRNSVFLMMAVAVVYWSREILFQQHITKVMGKVIWVLVLLNIVLSMRIVMILL